MNSNQRSGLYAGGEIEFRLPTTAEDQKTNVQVKLQNFSDACQAQTTAWICKNVDLTSFKPHLHKPPC